MTELQKLGLPGPSDLREILNTCDEPAAAIETFQNDNGIQVPSLKPALKLLDLHNVRRIEFHEEVLADLQEKLVARIQSFGSSGEKSNVKMIEKLLQQSFPLINVPQIRPVVLETLRNLPKIPTKDIVVQKIVQSLGDYVPLYDKLLQYIRKGFLDTKNPHYCSLRFELLMALHDAEVKALTDIDPCHAFVWCLDPCIRDKHLDPKHAAELKTFLDSVKGGGTGGGAEVWGDIAMIAGDPHVMHFFCSLAMKVLSQNVTAEVLPRDQHSLVLLLRMISLGSVAWKMQKEGEFKEPKPDSIFYTKFLPSLMVLMSEDTARVQIAKLHQLVSAGDLVAEESTDILEASNWIRDD